VIKLRNISLSIKLNLLLLMALGILLIATILLLFFNTGRLTEEIGNERIAEEVNIMQKRLAEVEKELGVDVNFIASSIPFIQAVGRRNGETVTELIITANNSLEMDDIDVVDGDGNRLADLSLDTSNTASEDNLLTVALSGTSTTGIQVEEYDGQMELRISAAAPTGSIRQGTILGAIQMSRQINDAFLRDLAFERSGVYLGLVYDNQILARTTFDETVPTILHGNISFDPESVRLAADGQIVLSDKLISSSNTPYAVAYIPILGSNATLPTALMILIELDEIFAFQNTTLVNTIIIFAVLAFVTMTVIYLSLQQIAIQPLTTLKTIAQKMTDGHYEQRIPVWGRDEVGQVAETFNEMAEAIQQRETNLQAARAQAERADQAKSAFLASMSHELRTPLNAVINFTHFVIDGDTGPVNEQQTELLTQVVNSGKHLLNLINDVLDMSKIEAGSLVLFIEDNIDLNALLHNAVSTGRSLLANKPVRLHIDIEDNLPLVRADRQRILQILLNIVSNACKFTEEGEIRVTALQANKEIVISIADTGPGIAPEDKAMVFEAFKQTTTGLRQGGGTGLGMPIARSLAEAHGGRLWLESEFGKGATFYIALPIKSEELVPMMA
jgi:signal transduction histidine kinase